MSVGRERCQSVIVVPYYSSTRFISARVRANFRHAALGTNVASTNETCHSNTSSITGPHNIACWLPAYTIKINELVGGTLRLSGPILA
jgi:hypothetical protein